MEYVEKIESIIQKVKCTQMESINRAAQAIASAISSENMIYAFGTGHSHMLAEEIFYRAGGLVKVYPILDDALMLHRSAFGSSRLERLTGYADILLSNYTDIKAGDVMLLFSNSGRNAVTVEMAMAAKKKGMAAICITNMTHSRSCASRHSSGLKLYDVCDIIIDNCGETGDACIDISGVTSGPTSTVIGAMILNEVICEAIKIMSAGEYKDAAPEVFISSNTDEGDAANERYRSKYGKIIKIF